MAAGNNPFGAQCLTLPISVTSTASTSAALPATGNTLRVVNEGPNVAFISVGTGAQTATLPNATVTATSTPVYPGDTSLGIPMLAGQQISAVTRVGATATLSVQVGEGI